MALHDYLTTEVGEDWADGIITRREALRRLALLGLSTGAAVALLEACAPAGSASPGLTPLPTGSAEAPATASAPPGSAATSTEPSPATPAEGEAITFPGPTVELQGFFAAPRPPAARCS